MDPHPNSQPSEEQRLALHAYHDGELSGFARWRFERVLRRSPALQRELAELQKLSAWMEEIDQQASRESAPDLWSEIGPALSRVDAEVGPPRGLGKSRARDAWSWGPLIASGAVAAAALLLLVLDNGSGIPEDPVATVGTATTHGSLRYLKTEGVSYVVSQESDDVTIIWLMDGAAGGGA
ncbi:MAG: hypothetical protein QF570_05715 [Myxococcota bacterium]|nr:hypothetical protein [Myxococcota bacterium]